VIFVVRSLGLNHLRSLDTIPLPLFPASPSLVWKVSPTSGGAGHADNEEPSWIVSLRCLAHAITRELSEASPPGARGYWPKLHTRCRSCRSSEQAPMAAVLLGSEARSRGEEARSSALCSSVWLDQPHGPGRAWLLREALCDKTPLLNAVFLTEAAL